MKRISILLALLFSFAFSGLAEAGSGAVFSLTDTKNMVLTGDRYVGARMMSAVYKMQAGDVITGIDYSNTQQQWHDENTGEDFIVQVDGATTDVLSVAMYLQQ